jgi:hypothetical protein
MYYNQRHTNVGWFQDKNLQLCSKRKERKQKKNSSRWYMYMLLIFLSSWDGRVLNRKSWRTIGKRAWVWQELALVTPVVINSIYAGMLRHGLKAAEMRKRHNNKRGKKRATLRYVMNISSFLQRASASSPLIGSKVKGHFMKINVCSKGRTPCHVWQQLSLTKVPVCIEYYYRIQAYYSPLYYSISSPKQEQRM